MIITWFLYSLSFLSIGYASETENTGCLLKSYGPGKSVCICNSDHCDYFFPDVTPNKINIIKSTQKGLRYSKTTQDFEKTSKSQNVIVINRSEQFQKIHGWGGALTDSFGINYESLPPKAADHLMRSYYTEDGSMYNFCRVPMGGSDFSTRAYSYHDDVEDEDLKNFELAPEDYKYKIPLMNLARNLSINYTKIKFVTAPWSSPKWMKKNNKFYGFNGYIKEKYYQTWANYFLKFFRAYRELGIDFWATTTSNEPSLSIVPFKKINSIEWTSEKVSKWVRENLGPTLRSSEFSDIKILAIDDQRYFYPAYASAIMANETTRNFIDGFSVHWYEDSVVPGSVLTETHNKFPDKFIMGFEASNGYLPLTAKVDIGSWERGEKYAKDIIDDLSHWVTGWIDWNLALDLKGGPTYVKNFVDSPILVNETSGEFYKQPMYYAIGHFSKFIPEDSVRIGLIGNNEDLPMVALTTPEPTNNTVVVIVNTSDEPKSTSLKDGSEFINLDLEERSFTTIIF